MSEESKVEQAPTLTLEELFAQHVASTTPTAEPPKPPESTEDKDKSVDIAAIAAEAARKVIAERDAAKAEDADLNDSVKRLAEAAGIKGKNRLVKGFLLARADEDRRLAQIWGARTQNPAAWDKALTILASELEAEMSMENPQLVENQRAMELSQSNISNQKPEQKDADKKFMELGEGDFARAWEAIVGRG